MKTVHKKFYIIITNDYEVFGDGSGHPEEILVQPTEKILGICNKYNVPMTLFVDVLELFAFRKAEYSGVFGTLYKAASKIEKQLKQAIGDGHDVQLHLHPQWIGSKPLTPDRWCINPEYWRLPFVPGGLGNPEDNESLLGIFYNGKRFLEELCKPIDPKYRCIAFRAGGYCIQPEKDVLVAMKESGILIDSSVCPGRNSNKLHAKYDFRSAPKEIPYYRILDSVNDPDTSGELLELPIFTWKRPRFRQFVNFWNKENKKKLRILKNSILQALLNFDYCKLTFSEMKYFLEMAMKQYNNFAGPVPIVITGHSKEYHDNNELDKFLSWALKLEIVEFSKFSNLIGYL